MNDKIHLDQIGKHFRGLLAALLPRCVSEDVVNLGTSYHTPSPEWNKKSNRVKHGEHVAQRLGPSRPISEERLVSKVPS